MDVMKGGQVDATKLEGDVVTLNGRKRFKVVDYDSWRLDWVLSETGKEIGRPGGKPSLSGTTISDVYNESAVLSIRARNDKKRKHRKCDA